MPQWIDDAVWWQVYPLGFLGAEAVAPTDGQLQHRLNRLEGWLDYLVELGANGLALGPIFAAETHGYDTVDHLRIDARLGDEADFDSLVRAAHRRGLRILLDGVFNHVGRGHPAFQQVLESGPDADTASWFRLRWPEGPWRPGVEPVYDTFEGHGALVALDHTEPDVARLVVDVMDHWCSRGADGWRLDAAYAVPPSFWAPVLQEVRSRHPEVFVVGEVIHGDYAGIVAASGMDSVTQYELWKAIWSGLNDRNFFELAWAMDRHDEFVASFLPYTFVGNHDVTRIASRLEDVRHLPHALVVLMTVGGTPSVYAGDEQGYRGVKEERFGGDDEIRPPFPESPEQFSRLGADTHRLHQELIGLRRRHRWLSRARTRSLDLANEHLCYVAESEEQRLIVALNLGDAPVAMDAPGAGVLLAGDVDVDGEGPGARVRVPSHGWAVLTG